MSTVPAAAVVDTFRGWLGTTYRFGGEQSDCAPRDVDCSEGVEWACRCAGIEPTMPDGSGNQFDHCDRGGGRIPFDQAAGTVGALLFKSYSDSYPPGDRNSGGIYHVAMVSGPDRTMEICCDDGDRVVERSISGRSWYPWGGLIPGVTYTEGDDDVPLSDSDFNRIQQIVHQAVIDIWRSDETHQIDVGRAQSGAHDAGVGIMRSGENSAVIEEACRRALEGD